MKNIQGKVNGGVFALLHNDPGLQYLKDIGFQRIKGKWGLHDQWCRDFGRQKGEEIWTQYWQYVDNGKAGTLEFYNFKSSHPLINKGLIGWYDSDIIRKGCNYIASHKEYFGKTILEVGCDCGIMSCFLARTFPDAMIVSIDRCVAAIEFARDFAQKQGLTNITFLACDLKDVANTFDTVFSMRTMHENYTAEEDPVNDLGEQAIIFKDSLSEYASNLSRVLSDHGSLISVERIGRNALLLGWMEALDESDLKFDLSCYEELICTELDDESVFQAFVCFKGVESDINSKDLFDYACSKYLDYTQAFYEGWDAKIVFENRRGSIIEGYNIVYSSPPTKVRVSLWTHRTDETCLVQYQNNNGNVGVAFIDISVKDEVIESMHKALDECRAYGNVDIQKMSDGGT